MNSTEIFELLTNYQHMVRRIARAEGFDPADFDDVRQQAALALLEAQRDFAEGRGACFTTFWLEGKLRPALRRERAAGRFGVELDDENVIFELPAAHQEENEQDQLEQILDEHEWETLGRLRDSAAIAQALGVHRRRAQQKINETIAEMASDIRGRLGIDRQPVQLGLALEV